MQMLMKQCVWAVLHHHPCIASGIAQSCVNPAAPRCGPKKLPCIFSYCPGSLHQPRADLGGCETPGIKDSQLGLPTLSSWKSALGHRQGFPRHLASKDIGSGEAPYFNASAGLQHCQAMKPEHELYSNPDDQPTQHSQTETTPEHVNLNGTGGSLLFPVAALQS